MIVSTRVFLIVAEIVWLSFWFCVVSEMPGEEIYISPIVMFLFCTIVPMIGGLAWSYHNWQKGGEPVTWLVVVSTVMNMGTFGGGASMFAFAWFSKFDYIELKIMGAIAILSLLGMPIIEWSANLMKSQIEKRFKDE